MILDFNFDQVMKLSSIKRWGIIDMSREQSVAEHSYNVTMISLAILDAYRDLGPQREPFPSHERRDLLVLALTHDLPEVFTGDIPTPVKTIIGTHLSAMEGRLFPRSTDFKSMVNPLLRKILKIADIIEAIQFGVRFCVDKDRDHILSEMIVKLANEIAMFHSPRLMLAAVEAIWPDAKTLLKNI